MKSQKVVKEGKSKLISGSKRKLTEVNKTDLKKDPQKPKTVIKKLKRGKKTVEEPKKQKIKYKRGVNPPKTIKNQKDQKSPKTI